ncbi:MAG: hypothetical protein R3E93_16745 [Thiothrix sp.]
MPAPDNLLPAWFRPAQHLGTVALIALHHSGLFMGDVLIDFSAETYPAGASLPRVIVHTHCMTVCFFGVPGVPFDNLLF